LVTPAPSRRPAAPRPEYVALATVLAGLTVLAATGAVTLPLRDFEEYWSAGEVFVHGGNPYDARDLDESLRAARGEADAPPNMMWNPPWTLPLAAPFSLLPIRLAHPLWIALQLTVVLVSIRLLAGAYGHLDAAHGPLTAAALVFPPTVFLLTYAQITGLCLIGVAGFVWLMVRGRPVPAGLCVALTVVKPHLLLAFGLFLLLAAIVSRPARVAVLAAVSAVAVSAGAAWLISPHVYADYFAALNAPPGSAGHVTVREWTVPVAGFWLRMWAAPDRFWVQFVPAAVAAVLAVALLWKVRRNIDWLRVTPALVLLSLACAPYGGWPFDLVLLLVPVCHAASAIGRGRGPRAVNRVLVGLAALGLLVMLAVPTAGRALHAYVWLTPLVAAGYVTALALANRPKRR
jgi:hypothetical protein